MNLWTIKCQPPPGGLRSMDTHTLLCFLSIGYIWLAPSAGVVRSAFDAEYVPYFFFPKGFVGFSYRAAARQSLPIYYLSHSCLAYIIPSCLFFTPSHGFRWISYSLFPIIYCRYNYTGYCYTTAAHWPSRIIFKSSNFVKLQLVVLSNTSSSYWTGLDHSGANCHTWYVTHWWQKLHWNWISLVDIASFKSPKDNELTYAASGAWTE